MLNIKDELGYPITIHTFLDSSTRALQVSVSTQIHLKEDVLSKMAHSLEHIYFSSPLKATEEGRTLVASFIAQTLQEAFWNGSALVHSSTAEHTATITP